MSTIEISAAYARKSHNSGLLAPVGAFFAALARRMEERRVILTLSRMSPRRLEDIGFDPAAVYGAVEGTWDEVDPGCFRHP